MLAERLGIWVGWVNYNNNGATKKNLKSMLRGGGRVALICFNNLN